MIGRANQGELTRCVDRFEAIEGDVIGRANKDKAPEEVIGCVVRVC